RDPLAELGADVLDAQHVDEELGQLLDARRDLADGALQARVAGLGGDDRVMAADHRGARRRGRDHGVEPGERRGEPLDERNAGVAIAGVEMHLAAAGLLLRKGDIDAEPTEQPDRRPPDLRIQQVVEAIDENSAGRYMLLNIRTSS